MSRPSIHLAQYNIAVLRHPMEHPDNRSFEELLDETNRLAEASPGFVWRHGIDSRDVDDTAYDDPLVLVNASVWESFEQLRDYAFRGWHRDVFKRRAEWFVSSAATMWWIPAGHVPSLHDCVARLAFQHLHGPSAYAFGMNEKHPQLVIHSSSTPATATAAAPATATTSPDRISLVAELDGTPVETLTLGIDGPTARLVEHATMGGPVSESGALLAWLRDAAAVSALERGCTELAFDDEMSRPIGRPYHWPPR